MRAMRMSSVVAHGQSDNWPVNTRGHGAAYVVVCALHGQKGVVSLYTCMRNLSTTT